MAEKTRTVFISYRHGISDMGTQAIRLFLKEHGYDVFLDVASLSSGRFEPQILQNIETRTFFLVILIPGSLERCIHDDGSENSEDWVLREIKHALNTDRHIIPILMNGFNFKDNQKYLVGPLERLGEYYALDIFHQYFDRALETLLTYLESNLDESHKIPLGKETSNSSKIEVVFKPPQPTQEELQAEESYNRAMKKYQAEDFNGAISDFTEAIHLIPQFAAAYGHRAIMRKNIGDIDGAIADYTKAIEFSTAYPYYAEYYYHNRGISYHIQGEYDKAIADYTQAIYLNPQLSEAYGRRGTSRAAKGDSKGAIRDYSEAIRVAPEDDMPLVNRGVAYMEMGNPQAALEDFTKGLELNPNRWEAYANRAELYVRQQDHEAAIPDFAKAIELNPDLPNLYDALANAYAESGNYEQAISVCTEALEKRPEAAAIFSHRGWLLFLMGEIDKAAIDFQQALSLNPDFPQAHNDLGVLLASQKKYDEATEHYTRAIELNHPKLAWPYSNRGEIRANTGDYRGALADCTEAIGIDSTYPNAFRIRAEVHKILGNHQEAIDDYQRYLDLGGWQRYNDKHQVELTIQALRLQLMLPKN